MSKNIWNEKKDISVLIIEDEVVLALGLEYTLKNFGYTVSGIKTNLQSTLNYLTTHTPDIAIVDIKLKGGLNGIDIAKYMWENKRIPIIFLTSYCDEKTIEKTLCCEPYGYLIKPCKEKELNAIIQTSINKHNRVYTNKDNTFLIEQKIYLAKDLIFHKGKSLLYYQEEAIKLTGNETKFLSLLISYPKETVCFERISYCIWCESIYDLGRLRTLVYRLKQKIPYDIIESVFETGYKLKAASLD